MISISKYSASILLAIGSAGLAGAAPLFEASTYTTAFEGISGSGRPAQGEGVTNGGAGSASAGSTAKSPGSSSSAYVDLSRGKMGVYAAAMSHGLGPKSLVTSTALARMRDLVTIFRDGTNVSRIPFKLDIDGSATGNAGAHVNVSIDGRGRTYAINQSVYTIFDELIVPLTNSATFDIKVELWAGATLNPNESGPSIADYSHTLNFRWDLPSGLTFASASGVFQPQAYNPVPEPASLTALAVGAFALLRRRRA